MESSVAERESQQAATGKHVTDALQKAGLTTDVKGYTQSQLERAKDADLSMPAERLRAHIMGNGDGKPAPQPRSKYNDRIVAIRDAANKLAESGLPFAAPVIPAQVQRIAKLVKGDPFSDGQPLAGMTKTDAQKVAKSGGRVPSARSVGEWKRGKRSIANDTTLDNRRIIAVCVAMQKVDAAA